MNYFYILLGIVASIFLGSVSNWIYDLLKSNGVFPIKPTTRHIFIIALICFPLILLVALPQLPQLSGTLFIAVVLSLLLAMVIAMRGDTHQPRKSNQASKSTESMLKKVSPRRKTPPLTEYIKFAFRLLIVTGLYGGIGAAGGAVLAYGYYDWFVGSTQNVIAAIIGWGIGGGILGGIAGVLLGGYIEDNHDSDTEWSSILLFLVPIVGVILGAYGGLVFEVNRISSREWMVFWGVIGLIVGSIIGVMGEWKNILPDEPKSDLEANA
jgi:hypothetical protein